MSPCWSLGSCTALQQYLSGAPAHMRVASGIVLREAGLELAGLRARARGSLMFDRLGILSFEI